MRGFYLRQRSFKRVLQKALAAGGYPPEQAPEQLAKGLAAEPEATYGRDDTERRRQRPCDAARRERSYSGKKKAHTVKNLIIGGLQTRKVNSLSQTSAGKRHDKKIADDENPT